ncbi:IPExxxVDY family protein [Flavobacterium sp.]|jgi:hypothetical protein|uniref:IPExxxVDY family protein n=1 Tax=Flavobacterium sp. TaxID=239 RepID=UPI003BC5F11D
MAIHKIHIEDFEEDDYHLIALHTSLEDYRLAYFLNKELGIALCKCKFDIPLQVKKVKTSFARFTFEDEKKVILWNLVQNKNEVENIENIDATDLFSNSKNSFSSSVYLLPEYKKVDFFVKIENAANEIDLDKVIAKISKMDAVNLAYSLVKDKIKSKNNLIF